ncbi:predicted protein [Pyrenophora tritici-repentis Pt-1C-BFP]|uniref:Uncharacterized protein n=1 Tax=Pyrenophora tritici-repentis (strain Pt-1C-BFP) TaxID=426418 RepID=B2WNL6_PYRTR|nr:uncharacterized protein PTRG_11576 [Pyrenophora tritici-repentis Pt-1C-BFP]EDU44626.1 predicted protein [Pyrenophora tritici-repentis Pt-1C-BFP]
MAQTRGRCDGHTEEGAMDGVFVAAAVAVSKWDGGVEQRRTKQVRYDLLQDKTTTQQAAGQLQLRWLSAKIPRNTPISKGYRAQIYFPTQSQLSARLLG